MNLKIMPWLFLVKINKIAQADFRQKLSKNSPFFIPKNSIHNSRNMECGEIVQIGEAIGKIKGWEKCKVGDTLIFHHTIESPISSKNKSYQYLLFEDEMYKYYAVDWINLRGFYDGEKITPHPKFVFLKNIPAFLNQEQIDESTGNKIEESEGGLLLVSWNDSPQNIAERSQKLKDQIDSLLKSVRTEQIQKKIEELYAEMGQLNRKAQKNEYLPYRVAYSNENLDAKFGRKIIEDDVLFCFNKACLYISNFQDKDYTYIVALIEHVGGLII